MLMQALGTNPLNWFEVTLTITLTISVYVKVGIFIKVGENKMIRGSIRRDKGCDFS
jgi:hypothetical protein